MNGSFYKNPAFPDNNQLFERDTTYPTAKTEMPMEQSYIENILRLNKGAKVKVYMSYADSQTHKDKVYTGTIKAAGRDHLIIEDQENGKWYLLLMIYLDYVEFDERINYQI